VYIAGIRYFVCAKCHKHAAQIPAVGQLLAAIARTLVERDALLTGPELRFLRKRLGRKAADLAKILSLTPEHYSRLETGKSSVSEVSDKMIRAYYAVESRDPLLQIKMRETLRDVLQKPRSPRSTTAIRARISRQSEWTARAA
jgi:transcriptional regulator with XRE-family HTH domain